jgi:hypothetical protein
MLIDARKPHLSETCSFLRAASSGVTRLCRYDVSPSNMKNVSKPTLAREVTTFRNVRRTADTALALTMFIA